ncbi:peroxidase catalase like protein [Zymoseptoria brevis]|uniref:Catalase-peroxidase n=1 Tax=Zymoseptoria brevis TaxID=1047168 RepID=A0A0F4GI81_9PEZI|nr:peroxidase catalase like protein [Zymoseptoria brevis]
MKGCLNHLLPVLAITNALGVDALCPALNARTASENILSAPHGNLEARYAAAPPDNGRCSRISKAAGGGTRSHDWWPCELSLNVLRQNAQSTIPLQANFDYATEFAKLDVEELKKDLLKVQTDSQSWWPADFGNYGPFFVRLSWHSAGTYRATDGRGGSGAGQQRFAPLNSWPDNGSLDKARRLLWPVKQKYGQKISWADLFVFAGNVAMESMGFPTYGFAFGRVDTWQADESIYWGGEVEIFPSNKSNAVRYDGSEDLADRADKLEDPLGAVDMGLIYVDPRGPNGVPDTLLSAKDIRKTFGRMGMNDTETVSLIAGGHAFGKCHGAVKGGSNIGPEPNNAPIEQQGFGWQNSVGTGAGVDAHTSGLEVIWSSKPLEWTNDYLKSLLTNNFTLVQSPDDAPQWEALDGPEIYPDPFVPGKFRRPTMLTSDLALRDDPVYGEISKSFFKDFDLFTEVFSQTWYKLLHRDMGPISRYLGPYVPKSAPFLWQDPLPAAPSVIIGDADIAQLKSNILASGLNCSELVTTAWGAASSFRISDKRGGANGGRIALEPQRSWVVNNPDRLATVLAGLTDVQKQFNSGGKQVSLADLIVLGGVAAIEQAAAQAGVTITVPFTPGRVDATQDQTDVDSFNYLQPKADGFRNYGKGDARSTTEELLVDKAGQLSLSPPELTVLVGGLRALSANFDGSAVGVLTSRPGQLTNDFFANLLDITYTWAPVEGSNDEVFIGTNRNTKEAVYTASRSDLIFGSHPELRAIAEVYASADAQANFVADFVQAWAKVMDLDRYDIKGRLQNDVQ